MGLIIVNGERFNHLERIVTAPVANPVAAASNPVSYLYDRFPSSPFRFGSILADSTLTFDMNLVSNGDMALAGGSALLNWTEINTGTGDVTRAATGGADGGPAMQLTNGVTSTCSAYQDITCRSGERLNITAALKGTGTQAVKIRVRNLTTGKWLKADGTWQTAQQDLVSHTANAWQTYSMGGITLEAMSIALYDLVSVRISLHNETSSTTVFANDVFLWPDTDLAAIGGHNLQPIVTPEWRASTDGFGGSDVLVATMAIARPSFYALSAATVTSRYHRLKFVGTPNSAPGLGEAFFCQKRVLSRQMSPGGMDLEWRDPQIRGNGRANLEGQEQLRTLTMRFKYDTLAKYEEAQNEVFRRGRGGATKALVIPFDSRPEVAYGMMQQTFTATSWHPMFEYWEGVTMVLEELDMPTFIN